MMHTQYLQSIAITFEIVASHKKFLARDGTFTYGRDIIRIIVLTTQNTIAPQSWNEPHCRFKSCEPKVPGYTQVVTCREFEKIDMRERLRKLVFNILKFQC
jgi:hypothetical protein